MNVHTSSDSVAICHQEVTLQFARWRAACACCMLNAIQMATNALREQHKIAVACSRTSSQNTKPLLTLPTVSQQMPATCSASMLRHHVAELKQHNNDMCDLLTDALKAVVAAAKPGARIVELCEKGDAAITA
jgi:hypothetical protein